MIYATKTGTYVTRTNSKGIKKPTAALPKGQTSWTKSEMRTILSRLNAQGFKPYHTDDQKIYAIDASGENLLTVKFSKKGPQFIREFACDLSTTTSGYRRLNRAGFSLLHSAMAFAWLGYDSRENKGWATVVDHISGDSQDNSSSNLQIISQSANCKKRKAYKKDNNCIYLVENSGIENVPTLVFAGQTAVADFLGTHQGSVANTLALRNNSKTKGQRILAGRPLSKIKLADFSVEDATKLKELVSKLENQLATYKKLYTKGK